MADEKKMVKIKELDKKDLRVICERFNDACECCGLYLWKASKCYLDIFDDVRYMLDLEVDINKLNRDREKLMPYLKKYDEYKDMESR
jgi:hypothetical protein